MLHGAEDVIQKAAEACVELVDGSGRTPQMSGRIAVLKRDRSPGVNGHIVDMQLKHVQVTPHGLHSEAEDAHSLSGSALRGSP